MTKMSAFSSPFLLGFDDVERVLDRAAKIANDGYPPYNIERLSDQDGSTARLRITLAVAGFKQEELNVVIEESQLVIRGRQNEEPDREFLHRGIAARQFQKVFVLADGMEILGAELKNGLLSVDLARPEPARVARRIEITYKE